MIRTIEALTRQEEEVRFARDSPLEEAVTSEPVSGKRPENSLPGGKNKTLGSRSNSPENGTPSGGGGPHYGILFPPITRTRARQPAPVQPLASRRVTYRLNRSNAPQNLLIFSHSGVASASASSGEQSLDAVDMSDAPSDQALAFPMGRRASFSRLWVPRTTGPSVALVSSAIRRAEAQRH